MKTKQLPHRGATRGGQRLNPTALFCLLPGLGDALVASVAMRRLHDAGWQIEVLAMLEPVASYARDLLGADHVTYAPLLQSVAQSIRPILSLRRHAFDAVYVPFPATRWQYAVVAAAIGGRKTYMHRYGGLSSLIASIIGATQVSLRGGHRVFENLRLIDEDIDVLDENYWLPDAWRANRIPGLLGVHVGTMAYKGNEARRWPVGNFKSVIEGIAASHPTRIFFGPHETSELAYFRALNIPNASLVCAPLTAAARQVSECDVFLTNDNGFSHLASGLGVKTLTLFGMTNPVRAQPLGPSIAVHQSKCKPCHDEGLRTFGCPLNIDYRCLKRDLSVEHVIAQVRAAFSRGIGGETTLTSRGPYQLYGVSRT